MLLYLHIQISLRIDELLSRLNKTEESRPVQRRKVVAVHHVAIRLLRNQQVDDVVVSLANGAVKWRPVLSTSLVYFIGVCFQMIWKQGDSAAQQERSS